MKLKSLLSAYTSSLISFLVAVAIAIPATAQQSSDLYWASIGTLPSAQGWVHFLDDPLPDDGLDESNYTVAAGVLTQGPTGGVNVDIANRQWYERPGTVFDFDDAGAVEFEFRARIVDSTLSPPGSGAPRAGFGVLLVDDDFQQVALYIGSSGLFIWGQTAGTSPLYAFDATSQFYTYHFRVDANGASVLLDGVEVASLVRTNFGLSGLQNFVGIGDVSALERSSSEIEYFRFNRYGPAISEIRDPEFVTVQGPPGRPNKTTQVAMCPAGKTAIGGGARINNGAGEIALSRISVLFGSVGFSGHAAEQSPASNDWDLEVSVLCAEVPGSEHFLESITVFPLPIETSLVTSCPTMKRVVSGGVETVAANAPRISVSAPAPGASQGWTIAAVDGTPTSNWFLHSSATCSFARDWVVRTASTLIDLTVSKSIGASCPIEMVAVGGGVEMLGNPVLPRITASMPVTGFGGTLPFLWLGEASTIPNPVPGEEWGIQTSVICAPIAEPTVTRHEITGRWRADSTFAIDERGANDGTLMNGATIVPGLMDQAFSFDAINSEYVEVPGGDFYPASSFTVDAWIQTSVLSGGSLTSIVSLRDLGGLNPNGANFSEWRLGLTPDGYATGFLRAAGSVVTTQATDSVSLADGAPHHVAVLRDLGPSRSLDLYVDGALVASSPLNSNTTDGPLHPHDPLAPDPLVIGAFADTGTANVLVPFEGLIDDVKYWDRALSKEEIENIAGCGVPILPRVLNVDASRFGGDTSSPIDHRLCVYLEPGSYELELTSPALNADARFLGWSNTSGLSTGWRTVYTGVGDIDVAVGGGIPFSETSAQAAFDNTVEKIVPFTVTTAQRVYFGMEDAQILDNQGGVSLALRVPEPGFASTCAAGALGLALLGRRRRHQGPRTRT